MPTATPRTNNREHILDTALTLMSRSGSSGTSMRRLADACGLNVAAIYHYFPSKEDLLATVIAERRYGSRIFEVPALAADTPPALAVRTVFGEVWDGALAEQKVWRLLLGEGLRSEAAALPVGAELLAVFTEGLTEWLRPVTAIDDPAAVARIVVGQLFAGFMRHIFQPDLDPDAIRDDCVDAVVALVGGPTASC